MSPNEREIIRLMRTGKRLNMSEIARQLRLPVSTVIDTIRRIENRYVIKRASLLNYPTLGYFSNARIAVKLSPSKKKPFLEFLKKEECVNSIFHINSGFDFMIDCVWKDALCMKEWILRVNEGFEPQLQVFSIIKVEETERFLPK